MFRTDLRTKPRKTPTWFALSEDRPLAAFAGNLAAMVWRAGIKANPVDGEHLVFTFLTTDANAEVGAIHPKAMPAILRTGEEFDVRLSAPMEEAPGLQRPLTDGALSIVARGQREDMPGETTWA